MKQIPIIIFLRPCSSSSYSWQKDINKRKYKMYVVINKYLPERNRNILSFDRREKAQSEERFLSNLRMLCSFYWFSRIFLLQKSFFPDVLIGEWEIFSKIYDFQVFSLQAWEEFSKIIKHFYVARLLTIPLERVWYSFYDPVDPDYHPQGMRIFPAD